MRIICLTLLSIASFQKQDFKHLTFPVSMYIEYVRVYQRAGVKNGIGCSPPSHPTADYITAYVLTPSKILPRHRTHIFSRHANAYTNPNLTTWDQAGYTFPRNSQYDGC